MDDLIAEFIAETNESLGQIDNDLIVLEQNPEDEQIIGSIFRLMHTIKGTCGFLGLSRLEKVAHHAENVLGRFRDKDLQVTSDYVTLILESIDQIKIIVEAIETTGQEPEGDDSALIAKLDAVYESDGGDVVAAVPETAPETADEKPAEESGAPVEEAVKSGSMTQEELQALEDAFNNAPGPDGKVTQPTPAPAPAETKPPVADKPEADATSGPPVSVQSLRVNVDVLENLMTMVSELVLTRNQLIQIMRVSKDSEFDTPLQRLNHVVSDLQEGVMQTRMQPVGNAWAKLPRIIRDISMELSKKIDLQMLGQETELDRQVLDLIKDPLTHMVRNSADHGIENPADRLAAGKPETGTIILNAFHEGGHIIMEIKDDGKGLNVDRIRQKALENGLATAEELDAMAPKQINQFIFAAGFSTAAEVTSVSGRGVGMDVVRTNIEKIGGTIDLDSVEGKGTTVTIKIPLTLAIVSALIVETAGERFAIPQLAVQELVMASAKGANKIEMIKGAPVYRLRDHLLPLIYLRDLLKLDSTENDYLPNESKADADLGDDEHVTDDTSANGLNGAANDNSYIIVTKVGAYTFGILVDKVYDTEEIVVKPVASLLKKVEIFSGNTILGDGTVIMILDPGGIARSTGEISVADPSDKEMEADAAAKRRQNAKTSLLLFEAQDGTPKSVPLSLVARLEDINTEEIEYSNDKMLIQYRGSLIPLIKFDSAMSFNENGLQPTLIFSDGRRSMGLMIKNILDIVEDHINVQINSDNAGCLGSAIIQEKATDVIDVGYFLNRAYDDWFSDHGEDDFSDQADLMDSQRRVLIVDDSPFFRNMLAPLLGVAGYQVETAEHPMEALQMMEKGEDFDLIVSDIEMPEMNGFQFAEAVRDNTRWSSTPMIALTSHTTDRDVARGEDVGFEQYVAKFDRETLLKAMSETLRKAKDEEYQTLESMEASA